MSVIKHGFVNIYRAGWFHRAGKPGNLDRHTGDIYDTYEKALASIDPPSHYVATVGISWADPEDVQPNPDDSVPVSISTSRKAYLRAVEDGRDPFAKDDFADVKRPEVPASPSPIHDPWGLGKLD